MTVTPREDGPATESQGLDLTARRLAIATLGAEAEDFGRPWLAAAFHRIGLMTEVQDCLNGTDSDAAAAVVAFCAEAYDRLTDVQDEAEQEQNACWVIVESASRWGDYLTLIDPDALATTATDDSPAPDPRDADASGSADDLPSAIDAGTLFRLLTGNALAPPSDGFEPEPPAVQWISAAPVAVGGARSLPAEPESRPHVTPPPANPARRATLEIPPPPVSLVIDAELRDIFLSEATDLFERIETLVLSLGRGTNQGEALREIGRCLHTLKGAAGSVDLTHLAALLHAIEEELDEASGAPSDDLIEHLHKLLHYLEGVFIALRRGGPVAAEPPRASVAVAKAPRPFPASPGPIPPPISADAPAVPAQPARETPSDEGPLRVSGERIDELMDLVSELITRRGLWAAQAESMNQYAAKTRICRSRMVATLDRLRDLRSERDLHRHGTRPADFHDREADVPELMRRLVEEAEDLVVLTEQAQATAKPLAENCDALARLTLQLWEALQAIRIVPVRGLFQRLMRVAHDAARVEARNVEVTTVGEETGLDRAVQDKAFEPLLHVVRNAVSHGIETPEERARAGKPAAGKVTLQASRTGNTLVLSVQDDGRGLDYEAIAAKGRRLGLIGPDDRPGVDRLNALIFQPGFTTREEANAIAGRGVGMDVVCQEVSRLHGTVSLTSERGRGTRLNLCLPARLALEQAMVLRVDGQAYALPVELIELAQPFEPGDVDDDRACPRVRMRDRLVPLISLRETLGLPTAPPVSCPKVLLVRAEGDDLAVLVDAIDGTRELVIKPLGPLLAGHPMISGTSLSVTSEVVFALSPSGLARCRRERPLAAESVARPIDTARKAPVLVVDDSISVRKVVARSLRELGYEVDEVSDGLEALGKIRNNAYCLIVSDLEMPRMDGFELLAELSRLTITPAVPVIVTSTRSDPETRRRVIGLGARAFIAKPIDPEALAALVRTHVHEPEAVTAPSPSGVENGPAASEHSRRHDDRARPVVPT